MLLAIVRELHASDQDHEAHQSARKAAIPEEVQSEHVRQKMHAVLVAEARGDESMHISRADMLQADKKVLHHEGWVNLPTQKSGNIEPHKHPQRVLAAGGWR